MKPIGDGCGGLIEIHQRTLDMHNLDEAKIKVRGVSSGFNPVVITIVERCKNCTYSSE